MKKIITSLAMIAILLHQSCSEEESSLVMPTDGLSAHYPLDGSAQDLTGINQEGVINGAINVANRRNVRNMALGFDGATSNVDLGDILDEIFSGEDKKFSFSFWIKPNASMSNNLIISKLGDLNCAEDQRAFTIRIMDNKINALFYYALTSDTFRRWEGSTVLESGTWYHIVVNYDGEVDTDDGANRLAIYINSELESLILNGSQGPLGSFQNGTAHLGLGNRLNSNGDNCATTQIFNGSIDYVRIYNRTLTLNEISILRRE
jgi:hypothetical protein